MVYHSPFSTLEGVPLAPAEIDNDHSTPWSEVFLEELRSTIQIDLPSQPLGRYNFVRHGSSRKKLRTWNRIICLSVFLMIVATWGWLDGREKATKLMYANRQLNLQPNLDGLQFIDATHPYIRYVGRWSATADGAHKDGSFPGVYFDFALNKSTTVLISIHNAIEDQSESPSTKPTVNLDFLPPSNISSALPISLLVRIDDEEYIVIPNATSIVPLRVGNLDGFSRHNIRVIAPMAGGYGTLQVEGIWIDAHGELLPFLNTSTTMPADDDPVGDSSNVPSRRKMLEVVTDIPGSLARRETSKITGSAHEILGGVMGWEYLIGEMFGSDHVTIGMDGMCLVHDCVGGRGSPVGLSDVFFQSGPAESEQYNHPWLFQDYTPDVIVMNLGSSDWDSFQTHIVEYNKSLWELSVNFEETYVAMIKAIRALAYPKYTTATVDNSRYIYTPHNAAGGIPIFIMRPFRGQLEQATHTVVDRLQKDGDKAIFWLDTSGWLDTEVDFDGRPEDQDFFLDEESPSKQWRLTERGNQRVAILLHMHVCQYLAQDTENCAFLPPEVYQGKAIDPDAIRFNDFLEDERERKLKKLFWE